MKRLAFITQLVMVGVLVVGPFAVAQETPSGKVSVESRSVALGVGVSWGDGVLTFKGKDYKFSVNGLSVVDLGVAKVSATGEVFNLKKVSDFAGNYVAGEAGATVGGGAGAITLKNQHGVVMRLTGVGTGVKFTLAGKGVEVKLKS